MIARTNCITELLRFNTLSSVFGLQGSLLETRAFFHSFPQVVKDVHQNVNLFSLVGFLLDQETTQLFVFSLAIHQRLQLIFALF
jgi:hypothetical protein